MKVAASLGAVRGGEPLATGDELAVARLLLESGGERRELEVTGPITIGRSRTATVYLDDKTLSREHTRFYLDHGRAFVQDLGSKNGTYLNGTLLKKAEALEHGDRVKVGVALFTVTLDDAPRPRQERQIVIGTHPAAAFVYRIALLSVVGGGAYLSKGLFHWLLARIPA
jgi:pSer/pThr/pTyr-binding forkhead associated (FHA) protein